MSESVLFVVNPIAGDRDKKSTISSIKSWAQSSDVHLHIVETTGKNDKHNIEGIIKKVAPDKVVSVGGDGTLVLCAHILKERKIPLGIIPMGSANGMATELNIPMGIRAGLDVIQKGKVINIDILNFADEDYGIHISDIGLNAKLVKHFDESGGRGFFGYLEAAIEEYVDPEHFEMTIKADGKETTTSGLMVAFANARRYGTGAALNQKGELDDGLMEICILRKLELSDLAEHLTNLVDDQSTHIEVIQCREAEVKTNRKVPFQIDGEVKPETDSVKVKVTPQSLRLIVPR